MNNEKINWFPGHMAKAIRKTEEDIKLCDGVIYVLDARAPFASVNDKLLKIAGNKPIIYALNKTDLVEKRYIASVVKEFSEKGKTVVSVNGTIKKEVEKLKSACINSLKEKIERDKSKGVKRTLRFIVVGIPNTGKSTIINSLAGGKRAETGDKAGVTRSNKWIRLGDIELLDTPGTMPPSMDNQVYAKHLAYIGCINDDILDFEGLALELIGELKDLCPDELKERFSLKTLDNEPIDLFNEICLNRGYIFKGGEYDYERGAKAVFSDFRKGKIAKVCLEERP